jgi:dipeptidyl aminopeptidase/acylaminoacyl peptidase
MFTSKDTRKSRWEKRNSLLGSQYHVHPDSKSLKLIPESSTYGFLDGDTLVIVYTKAGATGIIIYDITTNSVTELPLDLVHVEWNGIRCISPTSFVGTGGTTKTTPAIYLIDTTRHREKQVLKSSTTIDLPPEIFSPSQTITFPRTHGSDLSRPSHAIFVPPHNPSFEAPIGSLPPLIVNIHGGPSAHVSPALTLEAQYFTSRGYAYTSVNYAGSIGFGRAYRDDLNYSWGIKDIEDTLSCIDHLASQNLIDRERVAIRGGSSGGYTVFQALVCHPHVFAAGCSLYGIGNLKALVELTHKFESHYVLNLLFPSDTSEEKKEEIYRERSPCFHVEKIETPLVLFQGSEDIVVPMQQSLEMEKVLREGGKDVTLIIFEGEGHGFKEEENLKRRIEEEEALYVRTLIA